MQHSKLQGVYGIGYKATRYDDDPIGTAPFITKFRYLRKFSDADVEYLGLRPWVHGALSPNA